MFNKSFWFWPYLFYFKLIDFTTHTPHTHHTHTFSVFDFMLCYPPFSLPLPLSLFFFLTSSSSHCYVFIDVYNPLLLIT